MESFPVVPWHRRFGQLMPFRVREILLVSSAYDAFVLEEDGSLSDRLFLEYSELNLSSAPRLSHAASKSEALRLLESRHFDLVITVVRIGDTDARKLSRIIKRKHQDLPVILLLFDAADLQHFPNQQIPHTIDWVFQWAGDAGLLIAAIKLVEDARNVKHDTDTAGVQVILVVEDDIDAYSNFLSMLYPELLSHSGSLIAEGLNRFHRLLRMRARPKIVLARDYEQGLLLFERHAGHVCALMSDIRIPRGGKIDPRGGIRLAKRVLELKPELPILFQSAETDLATLTKPLGAAHLVKKSHDFRPRVRTFLSQALGFGDFVFRLPDGTPVARARDTYEMEEALQHVPAESMMFHATRNHFSLWFMARSMFELAHRLRPRVFDDRKDIEVLREELVAVLQQAHQREQEGVITDFSARYTGPHNRFVRVGRGSVGGKGRGIAFVSALIVRYGLLDRYEGLQIRIPKTVVIGTDVYDHCLEKLDMPRVLAARSDDEVTSMWRDIDLPSEVVSDLWAAVNELKGPLAVRSSSLLEDSRFQPFAGVYATYMLPNNHADPAERLAQLCQAIQSVYASVFWREARTYVAGTPHEVDEQKMAIVIQQVVGKRYGDRFYPHMSGVAQSYNDYPIGKQKPEEGVAHVALGLGHIVVGGGSSLRFSPASPTVLPQYANAESVHRASQREFWAVDLSHPDLPVTTDAEASLKRHPLEVAQQDGPLSLAGSVYCEDDDVIRENLKLAGPRVVTFNNLLKWNAVPVSLALSEILALLRERIGAEVEIEFALDMADWGRSMPKRVKRQDPRLYILQVRPMAQRELGAAPVDFDNVSDAALLCRTDMSLGHGSIETVRDIVYVTAHRTDPAMGRAVIERIDEINHRLAKEQRHYMLVGPGRWGSSDPYLGISVHWPNISGVRVIVEQPMEGRHVEPSQGTHFFRNVTARRIGYLTVRDSAESWLDLGWLDEHEAVFEDELVRHVRLAEPIGVYLDGPRGRSVISHERIDRAGSPPHRPQRTVEEPSNSG